MDSRLLCVVVLTVLVKCTFSDFFTKKQKYRVLKKHNDLRRQEGSSDMKLMRWNPELEKRANEVAEKCAWEASFTEHRRYDSGDGYIHQLHGENMAAHSQRTRLSGAVDTWYSEKAEFNCSLTWTEKCGEYTQTVWADSYQLGCAAEMCSSIKGVQWSGAGVLMVCHYGPGGNYVGVEAHKNGDECSKCEEGWGHCCGGLCARERCDIPFDQGSPSKDGARGSHSKDRTSGNKPSVLLSFFLNRSKPQL